MLLALQPEARFGARMQPPNESWHYTMVTLNGCSAKPPNRGFPFVPEKKGNRSPNQPILPYLREVINKHARVFASPSRAASATSFAHLSETLAPYRNATTHSGGTRSLCHSEQHSADTFESAEVYYSNMTQWIDLSPTMLVLPVRRLFALRCHAILPDFGIDSTPREQNDAQLPGGNGCPLECRCTW